MNFFNRALDRVIAAREEEAVRYINEYMADRGLDKEFGMMNPRG